MKGPDMRRVILESPYAGDIERHLAYARLCVRDCLSRGETPLVSHLLFTQPGILDDAKPAERELGIAAGHAWIAGADAVVVYLDFGISRGMHIGIAAAVSAGKPVEYRRLVLPGGAETRTPQCAETPLVLLCHSSRGTPYTGHGNGEGRGQASHAASAMTANLRTIGDQVQTSFRS